MGAGAETYPLYLLPYAQDNPKLTLVAGQRVSESKQSGTLRGARKCRVCATAYANSEDSPGEHGVGSLGFRHLLGG